jgi:arylsulfatase A-like enzyme
MKFFSFAATFVIASCVFCSHGCAADDAAVERGARSSRSGGGKPNIVLILADDLGFSDIGCYGSEIATPNLDRLAKNGLRFRQFYNAARCCPTRAAVLTGLYPHQAGVGHMLERWREPGYSTGLNEHCATIAQLLRQAGYRTYHIGKWHVGSATTASERNYPMNRGFDHAHGTGGGGNYFALKPLYDDRKQIEPGPDFYATDAFTDWAVERIEDHGRSHAGEPFFLHLCYTAPHFPLHARPRDIEKHRGNYRDGWDALRARRYTRQKELGVISESCLLSPRDPVARAWSDVAEADRAEWDLRMSVYSAMIDCMDRGIGRVLEAIHRSGASENTVVMFLSDNGASAEALDTWPNPDRGNVPGSVTGTRESHRCLEVGWANAANTPFREHKMWVHEGGISTPLIVSWPGRIRGTSTFTNQVGHIIDLMPTCLELAGLAYPKTFQGRTLIPLEGRSLVPTFQGRELGSRTLAWEHEGNRAIRSGDWKLVATFRGPWELFDLASDRSEVHNVAAGHPAEVERLKDEWTRWAQRVGVVNWEQLPGSRYKPTRQYRKKSEPVAD